MELLAELKALTLPYSPFRSDLNREKYTIRWTQYRMAAQRAKCTESVIVQPFSATYLCL